MGYGMVGCRIPFKYESEGHLSAIIRISKDRKYPWNHGRYIFLKAVHKQFLLTQISLPFCACSVEERRAPRFLIIIDGCAPKEH